MDVLVRNHAELVKRIAYHLAGRLPPQVEVDDLIQAEPAMDAKLQSLDPRKLARLRRIARLERGFCGEAEW